MSICMYYVIVFYGEMVVFTGLFYVYQFFFKKTHKWEQLDYNIWLLIESNGSKIIDEGMISHWPMVLKIT